MRVNPRSRLLVAIVSQLLSAVAVPVAGGPMPPQDPAAASPTAARALLQALADRHVDALAVEDPARPGVFVAARAYPGVQLLVLEAQSTAADYVRYQIGQKRFADAYTGLDASAVAATKWFVQDMGCDGLPRGDGSIDIVYEHGVDRLVLDGTGKASGLSKSQYATRFRAAEESYGRMLALLLGSLTSGTSAQPERGASASSTGPETIRRGSLARSR